MGSNFQAKARAPRPGWTPSSLRSKFEGQVRKREEFNGGGRAGDNSVSYLEEKRGEGPRG